MSASEALSAIPIALREPLLKEYSSIVQNYSEHRWSPSELSGGLFCEIVYTILEGHASGTYASAPSKPRDFVGACRRLEENTHVPRSFQILIPRLLPALYEVRNNRGVGHTGGDVDPNHMDATFGRTNCNWVMGEFSARLNKAEIGVADAPLAPTRLAGLIRRIADNTIFNNIAKKVFDALWNGEAASADAIIAAQGLKQVTDAGAIEALVEGVLAANQKSVDEFRAGKEKALNALVGQVMKASRGKANPSQVNELLRRKLTN